ncbi:MAG TPA: hypothetical protein VGR62_26140 [Candidatus Binatia bacterium]|jgi:hypothetical protein|nr:hypothetical protein [Candidatus Binatia bacterium]
MTTCDELLTHVLLHGDVPPEGTQHLTTCAECAAALADVRRVTHALAADDVPAPTPALSARVRLAAEPLLAARRRRVDWLRIAAAVAAAILPLPLILAIDWWVVTNARQLLSIVLPDAVSLFLVGNYAALLALLLTLTYAAVPLLAGRQLRPALEDHHV